MPPINSSGKKDKGPSEPLVPCAKQGTGENASWRKRYGKEVLTPEARLALPMSHENNSLAQKVGKALAPEVRLALQAKEAPRIANTLAPSIKLAHVPGAQGDNNLIGQRGVAQLEGDSKPALLISYYYLDAFLANQENYAYRNWVMDSGAFSAHNSGKEIKLQDYIDCCKQLMSSDPTLVEIYALDVIGNHDASIKNCEEMWRQGVPAIPTFHYGSPWEALKYLAATYSKIAIGGCVGKRDKDTFAGQCFARVWPKKIHGFGFGAEKSIMTFPFHSVDATNWEMGPCAFGRWQAFGGNLSVRGSSQNLKAEVDWYLELERKAQERWKKEMQLLEQISPSIPLLEAPSIRLVAAREGGGQERLDSALPPTVRLAVEPNAAGGKRIEKTLTKPKKESGS